jgi:hypothetical protein
MPYSIWSRGRLVGHTDLGFIYRENGFRTGWFHPNELGDKLMPTATGVAPAMRASHEAGKNVLTDPDVTSAYDYEQALELELRAPDGKRIETEHLAIIDTEYLLSIPDPLESYDHIEPFDCEQQPAEASESEDEDDWLADEEPDEPWRAPEDFPRYQIQICLVDHDAVPY